MAKQPSWSKEDFPQEENKPDKSEDLRKFIIENIRVEIYGIKHTENSVGVSLLMKNSKGKWIEFSSDQMTL